MGTERLPAERVPVLPVVNVVAGSRRGHLDRVLAIVLVFFCLAGVFGRSLWGQNDAREGGMVWDMYRHGTLVAPTSNGEPYWEKPPLMFWAALLACHVAGHVGAGLVRLPSALAGLGTLALLHAWIRRERRGTPDGGFAEAWTATFLCATALTFLEYSRIVLTDMTLTFVVTASLYLFWRAWRTAGDPKGGRAWRWAPFLAVSALAFFAKGLVGPALVWCSIGVFLVVQRRFRLLAGLAAAYLVLFVAVVGPWAWALYAWRGAEALRAVFWDNQFGRFFTFGRRPDLPVDPYFVHKEAWHYYLRQLPEMLLPWTPLVAAALVAWWRRGTPFRGPFATFVRSATAGMLLLLHASSAKVGCYALPVFPFLFIATGAWVTRAVAAPRRAGRVVVGATVAFALAVAAAGGIALAAGWWIRPELLRVPGTSPALPWLAVLAAAVPVSGLVLLVRERGRVLPLAPAAFALSLLPLYALAAPVMEWHRTVAPVVAAAREEERLGCEVALASRQSDDPGNFTFYLDRRLPVVSTEGEADAFLGARRPRALLVRRDELAPGGRFERLGTEVAEGRVRERSFDHAGLLSRSFALLVNEAPQRIASSR